MDVNFDKSTSELDPIYVNDAKALGAIVPLAIPGRDNRYIEVKELLSQGLVHLLKAVSDIEGDRAEYGYWVVDTLKPNPDSPYGYDYAMWSDIQAELKRGTTIALTAYAGANSALAGTDYDVFYMSRCYESGRIDFYRLYCGMTKSVRFTSIDVDSETGRMRVLDNFGGSAFNNQDIVFESQLDSLTAKGRVHRIAMKSVQVEGVYVNTVGDGDRVDSLNPDGVTVTKSDLISWLDAGETLVFSFYDFSNYQKRWAIASNVIFGGSGNSRYVSIDFFVMTVDAYILEHYHIYTTSDSELVTLQKFSDVMNENYANKVQSIDDDRTHYPSCPAVKIAIDTAVASAYHAAGTKTVAQLTSSLLVAANQGNVYNITDSGTTTADFVEGAGHPIVAGDNVGICDVGGGVYKFDLLSGFVDLSGCVAKTDASTANPAMDGTASPGTSTSWSRGDHVHPTDATREATSNKKQVIVESSSTDFPSSAAVAQYVKDMCDDMYMRAHPPAAYTLRFKFHDPDYDASALTLSFGSLSKLPTNANIWDWTFNNSDWSYALAYVFEDYEVDLIDGNTAGVTAIGRLFQGCTSIVNVVLFDTSSVNNAQYAFEGCNRLAKIPRFDTSSMTDMSGMFKECYDVTGGALYLYNQASSQTTPPIYHTDTFRDCGLFSDTGREELRQIPSSWGGPVT